MMQEGESLDNLAGDRRRAITELDREILTCGKLN